MSGMIIIVTGTISPGKNVGQLTLRDSNERLKQYTTALLKTIEARPDADIVFCDNSGFGTDCFDDVLKYANEKKMKLEVLSFAGDKEAVVAHGKGYGEGEIVKYVLENSKLAQGKQYMIKLTGRLVTDNIADIVKHIKRKCIYFNIPNIHRRDIYDTRIYAMPINIYNDYFYDEYRKVNDNVGYFLEGVYTDVISNNKLHVNNFPRYPRIVGKSGSGGISYTYTEWKCKIRDFLSIFNIYGKVK